MIRIPHPNLRTACFTIILFLALILCARPSAAQGGRYWDQNLNSEAALLSGNVVAGEGGIAAIYYNPSTISEMTKNNLSLSANLFSVYLFNAKDALGNGLPADRTQLNIYPRIITLTLNPRKIPDLTIEMAYFTKSNEYLQINKGTSLKGDIIASNPGDEYYTGEYYLRSKFQDYYGGAGFGYKLSNSIALGFSGMISYKDDQYYNLITANAFTLPEGGNAKQYVSDSRYHFKYNMYDVRLITKLGFHIKKESWSFGTNISLPSLKLFGDGTVVKQFEYTGIHKEAGNPAQSDTYYGSRQKHCAAHFKDPLSVAAGANYYSPSGKSIFLITAEYFFGLPSYTYIEAKQDPGEEGYDFGPYSADKWLSVNSRQIPVFNVGMAFKQYLSSGMMLSGGFRTDFKYLEPSETPLLSENNAKPDYAMNVYHLNWGVGNNFKRGSITLGMQFSYGQDKAQSQIVNLTQPVEYISDTQMPLTGHLNNQVMVRYFDISVYFGFQFNFMKE